MGASRQFRLSQEAREIIDWANRPVDSIGRRKSRLRRLHSEMRDALDILMSPTFPLNPPRKRNVLVALPTPVQRVQHVMFRWQRRLPPLPHRVGRAPTTGPPRGGFDPDKGDRLIFVPDWARVGEEGKLLYFFGQKLLEEVWTKGADRIKRCQWKGCDRFLWDPTNRKNKEYCEKIHDRERMKLRERKSRRNES